MVTLKILLSNIGGLENEGINMMVKAITQNINAKFYYHKLTVCRGYEKYGVKGSWRCWGYDLALDLGGDTFTIYYGNLQFLRHCFHLFKLYLFNQHYIIFSQTLCNYGFFSGLIAKFFLEKAELILVREPKSLQYLKNKKLYEKWVLPKIYLTGDIAFLLENVNYKDYFGDSYHLIIKSKLSGNKGVWNKKRKNNWKFTIFDSNFNLNCFKELSKRNVELLLRKINYS